MLKKVAKRDQLGSPVIHYEPKGGLANLSTSYNYTLPVSINKDEETFAEIDSYSHINLISEDYFHFLSKNTRIEYLQEPPTSFSGMGSKLKSSYPPIMLNVQVGSVVLKARFVVTDLLKSAKILLNFVFSLECQQKKCQ